MELLFVRNCPRKCVKVYKKSHTHSLFAVSTRVGYVHRRCLHVYRIAFFGKAYMCTGYRYYKHHDSHPHHHEVVGHTQNFHIQAWRHSFILNNLNALRINHFALRSSTALVFKYLYTTPRRISILLTSIALREKF